MYNYLTEKPEIFKEENQYKFLLVRDRVLKVLSTQKYIDMAEATNGSSARSWLAMAFVDRLVELGEITEITKVGTVAGQDRIFKK